MKPPEAVAVYLLFLVVLASFLALAFLSLAQFIAVIAPGLSDSPAWPDPDRRAALEDVIWPVFALSCMALGGLQWWRGRRRDVSGGED